MFKIEFSTSNAAFTDYPAELEVSRILDGIRAEVLDGITCANVFDYNGNKIGHWVFDLNNNEEE